MKWKKSIKPDTQRASGKLSIDGVFPAGFLLEQERQTRVAQ